MIIFKIVYFFLLIGAVFFAILYSGALSLWLLAVAIILPIVIKIVSIITKHSLKVNLEALKLSENKNAPIQFTVHIKNKSIFPVSNSTLNLEYFNILDKRPKTFSIHIPIQPSNSQAVTFTLSSNYCGRLNVQLKNVVLYDFFKLSKTTLKLNDTQETIILPQSYDLDILIDTNTDIALDSEKFSKVKAGDDCSEIFNFKDYQYGDKINRINWKLSTKQDKLLIKEYSLPIKTNILVLFEFFRDNNATIAIEKLDTLIELVVSLCEKLADNEIFHSIRWYNSNSSTLDTETISNSEDVSVFLGKLLQTQAYSNFLNTFEQHNALYDTEQYSHVVYITPKIGKTIIQAFADNQQSHSKTILYVTDNTSDTTEYTPQGDINIVQVQTNNIMASIQELII